MYSVPMLLLRQKLWFVMSLGSDPKYFNCYILLPCLSLQLWTTPLLERLLLLEFSIKSGKHQNQVRFKKNLQKKYLSILGAGWNQEKHHFFLWETEFHPVVTRLSLFLSASTDATYIFTAPTCTTTIITLETCASTVKFQRFIPGFNKKFLTLHTSLKEGIGAKGGPKTRWRQGEFMENSDG